MPGPKIFVRSLLATLFLSSLAVAAMAQNGGQPNPRLRISTEQHLAPIAAVAVSRDGRLVATAGADKTIRLWNPADGTLVQVLRTPVGEGPDGLIYTLAFSSKGDNLLAGGISYDQDKQNGIFAISPRAEQMLRRFPVGGGLRRVVVNETATGETRAALALSGANGAGAVELRDGRFRSTLFQRLLSAPAWIEFLPDGGVLAVTDGGELYLHRQDQFKLVHRFEAGATPAIVRPSPDGTLIAVGYWNRPQVDVLRLSDLRVVASLAGPAGATTTGRTPHFNALAWQPRKGASGGGELWAAGSHAARPSGRSIIRRWASVSAGGVSQDLEVAEDVVTALEPLPDGGMVVTAADPAWGIIGADFKLRQHRGRPGADFRAAWRSLFAADEANGRIAFRYDAAGTFGELVFDTAALGLSTSRASGVRTETGALAPGWRGAITPKDLEPRFDSPLPPVWRGRLVTLLPNENARSADTIQTPATLIGPRALPAGGFLLGADFGVYLYDADGKRVAEASTPTAAFAVLTLSDGRILAAHGDGTLRWYHREADRLVEEAALFIARDPKGGTPRQWLAWTPDGRFAHSANGGQALAGYHIDQGPQALARWVGFSQIYADAYAPAAVRAILREGMRSTAAVPVPNETKAVAVPEVRIIEICPLADGVEQPCLAADEATRGLGAVAAGAATADHYVDGVRELRPEVDSVKLRYRVTNIDGIPDKIDVLLNDTTTGADLVTRGIGQTPPVAAVEPRTLTGARRLFLQDGVNRIVLRIYDRSGAFGVSRELALYRPAAGGPAVRPKLHVLAIGANDYKGELAGLTYAAPDAAVVADALRALPARNYRETSVRSLIGGAEVSRHAVLDALDKLAGEVQPEDSLVVYLAGHGIQTRTGRYVFVPPEIDRIDRIETDGLDQDALLAALGRVRARNRLLLLDTCHAGAFEAPERAAGTINNEGGFMVIAAAAPQSQALDGYNGRNGVFAYALSEGLHGAAAFPSSRQVEAASLGLFLARRVPTLAAEKSFRQQPVVQNAKLDIPFPLTEPDR